MKQTSKILSYILIILLFFVGILAIGKYVGSVDNSGNSNSNSNSSNIDGSSDSNSTSSDSGNFDNDGTSSDSASSDNDSTVVSDSISLTVSGELSSYAGYTLLECYTDSVLTVGEELQYGGETAVVREYDSDYGFYTLRAVMGGKFCDSVGKTITVSVYQRRFEKIVLQACVNGACGVNFLMYDVEVGSSWTKIISENPDFYALRGSVAFKCPYCGSAYYLTSDSAHKEKISVNDVFAGESFYYFLPV